MLPRPTPIVAALFLAAASLLSPGCAAPAKAPTTSMRASFWPTPPAEPRIQFLRSFGTAGDIEERKPGGLSTLVLGKEGEQDTPIKKPYGVAATGGRIYICDIRTKGVVVLDLQKKQARLMGTGGLNRLMLPVDVAVGDNGDIYVADKDRNAVIVYDASERYLKTLGRADFQPVGVAVFKDRLYVCNMKSQLVEILDRSSGRVLGTIGSVGDSDGQFRLPIGIDVDADGQVHVMDMMRGRLQTFTPEGVLVRASGDIADTAGHFVRPKHIAVDDDGITYVVDSAFDNVQMFDAKQQLLMHFGSSGTHKGAMNLPVGVCVLEDGLQYFQAYIHPGFAAKRLVIVTNQFGDEKVSVYALGERRPEWSLERLASSAEAVPEGVSTAPPLLSPADDKTPVPDADPAAHPPAAPPPAPKP